MLQDIYSESSTKKYPIGMRYARDDRVFRYCRAGSALLASYGAYNANLPVGPIESDPTIVIGAGEGGVIDSKTVVATVASVLVDDFAEGFFVDWTPPFRVIRIRSNTATNGSGDVTFTLYDALKAAVEEADSCALYHNIYSRVEFPASESGFQSVVCLPPIDVQNTFYFWGQTWGPCFGLVAGGSNFIGKTAKKRRVNWAPGGGGMCCDIGAGNCDEDGQPAGFLLCNGNALTNGDQFMMLQLAP